MTFHVWYWPTNMNLEHDVPVPYAEEYETLYSAMDFAARRARPEAAEWVKVFGVSERDELARWDQATGWRLAQMIPAARQYLEDHGHVARTRPPDEPWRPFTRHGRRTPGHAALTRDVASDEVVEVGALAIADHMREMISDGYTGGPADFISMARAAIEAALPLLREQERLYAEAEAYAATLAHRTGVTPDDLAGHGLRILRCQCGDADCPGWAAVNWVMIDAVRTGAEPHRPGIDYTTIYWPPE